MAVQRLVYEALMKMGLMLVLLGNSPALTAGFTRVPSAFSHRILPQARATRAPLIRFAVVSDDDSDSVSNFLRARNSSDTDDDWGAQSVESGEEPVPADGGESDKAKGSVFDRMVDYPCTFQIKVIGLSQGHFAGDMLDIVSRVSGVAADEITYKLRDTKTGKYRSITLDVPVQNAAMLYECYEALSKDPRVKFKF